MEDKKGAVTLCCLVLYLNHYELLVLTHAVTQKKFLDNKNETLVLCYVLWKLKQKCSSLCCVYWLGCVVQYSFCLA